VKDGRRFGSALNRRAWYNRMMEAGQIVTVENLCGDGGRRVGQADEFSKVGKGVWKFGRY
jgi:hypothetical protein